MTPRLANGLLCLGMLVIGVVFIAMSLALEYPSNVFPILVCVCILAFSAVIFVTRVLLSAPASGAKSGEAGPGAPISLGRVVIMAAAGLTYVILITPVGFYTVSFATLMALFLWAERGRITARVGLKALGVTLLVLVSIYLVFTYFLSVPTPTGIFI